MDTAQESDLEHFLGDLSHIEKKSEIKLPLSLELIVGSTFFKNANATLFFLNPLCNSMQGSTTRHYHHHHSGHSKKENQLSDQMTHEF